MQLPDNGTASPEQQLIQKYYSLLAQDPDQASTAAPPDDERDIGREEALRMDEEIMDFQWFEHVYMGQHQRLAWHNVCPTSHEVQVCVAASPTMPSFELSFTITQTSPASESAWKALVLSSWLLLGRPAVNTSESNCAHFLDARLELFLG